MKPNNLSYLTAHGTRVTHRRDARLEVRMLYVARLHNDDDEQERRRRDNYSSLLSLHNGTGTRVRAHDEARLEAGWVQCMRHARARLGKNDDATAFALGWYRQTQCWCPRDL